MITSNLSQHDKTQGSRSSAATRRDALIDAAVHEFARGGLHGTPVTQIAQRVGVAQPYVFSLFATKRELFLAAVGRGFDVIEEALGRAAASPDTGADQDEPTVLNAIKYAYLDLLDSNPDHLLIQQQAYAACGDELIRERVRDRHIQLMSRLHELSGASPTRLDEIVRYGAWLNVIAALDLGV